MPCVKQAHFSHQEIENHFLELLKILEIEERCQNKAGYCNQTHYRFERNQITNQLKLVAFNCPKYELFLKEQWNNPSYSDLNDEQKKIVFNNEFKPTPNQYKLTKYLVEILKGESKLSGMFIYGDFQTGKTFLIAAFLNTYLSMNPKKHVSYILLNKLNLALKKMFSNNSNEADKLKKTFCDVDLLVIDGFGVEQKAKWLQMGFLLEVLEYRYEHQKPTIFISNRSLNDLKKYYDSEKDFDHLIVKKLLLLIKSLSEDHIFHLETNA